MTHCNRWDLLRSYAQVRELIEMLFGVVNGVSLGIHVLDGVQVPQEEGKVLDSLPHWFQWRICILCTQKCIGLVCEKFIVFAYGKCIMSELKAMLEMTTTRIHTS